MSKITEITELLLKTERLLNESRDDYERVLRSYINLGDDYKELNEKYLKVLKDYNDLVKKTSFNENLTSFDPGI